MIKNLLRVALAFSILSFNCLGEDVDKVAPAIDTPVQRAVKSLPKVAAAPTEEQRNNDALAKHLNRVKDAPDAGKEAAEIEALVAWIRNNDLIKAFKISLGLRCPKLTDEELLALSSWPSCTLTLEGCVSPPVVEHTEITFKDSKNLLRLIPLAAPTRGGKPQ